MNGLTVREVAKRYRVGPDKVRGWIRRGELAAINTADVACGRPRFVVTSEAIQQFEKRRAAAEPQNRNARPRRRTVKDYFPD